MLEEIKSNLIQWNYEFVEKVCLNMDNEHIRKMLLSITYDQANWENFLDGTGNRNNA